MLVEARVPLPPPQAGWAFLELSKRAGDFALVAVSVLVEKSPSGTIYQARIALAAVGDRPLRANPRPPG